jgi:hypothetical protein
MIHSCQFAVRANFFISIKIKIKNFEDTFIGPSIFQIIAVKKMREEHFLPERIEGRRGPETNLYLIQFFETEIKSFYKITKLYFSQLVNLFSEKKPFP